MTSLRGTGVKALCISRKNGKVIVDFKFYVKNDERGADADFKAGDGGVVVKPQKNEDNEITWESENDTPGVARLHERRQRGKVLPEDDHQMERPGLHGLFRGSGRLSL